ncbi:MAG: PspC domain-containing protein [Alistipes sp.]|nr:PspC domain-containing protein [Alistipes sp.]MBQ6988497.1 PspC domain-containing protein [Alistipes sp.]MBR2008129.1 PspC domain-containing protein [Alistipes sp.]MBR2629395.1 PspC domain-containing protein [Alistipes sp.]
MKETINVNLAQQAFTMDKDAYVTLTSYLDDIGRRLPADDTDTLPDIEARIAEIFRERVPSPMMVITYATVLATMQQIGNAEMFGEANRPLNDAEQPHVGKKSTRRFVRSIDDKAIAGVCGGIAEYFGIDSTLVRIIFVVGVIAGFSTGLLYFILWLVTEKQSRTTTK